MSDFKNAILDSPTRGHDMLPPEYEISTDVQRLSTDVIHNFISASYWGAGRTRDLTERATPGSPDRSLTRLTSKDEF